MTRRACAALATSIALAGVAGCTTSRSPSSDDPAPGDVPRAVVADQQIALDFVNAIVQLVGPDTAPLSFAPEDAMEPVLGTMRAMLGEAGYDIAPAGAEPGGQAVSHRSAEIEHAEERLRRHDVVVGSVELQRSYRRTGSGTVLPASALYVRGGDAASVRMMDERLFGTGGPGDGMDRPLPLPAGLLTSYGYLLVGGASAEGVGDAPVPVLSLERADDETVEPSPLESTANVSDLGRSNYAAQADALDTVARHDLTFPPGSDRLDAADVAMIDDVLARFEPETDIVHVVGYSAGGTAGLDANRDLALRRAERVRRAFVAVGVPAERVLVEGYWSESESPDVPSSGATLSLRRVSPRAESAEIR